MARVWALVLVFCCYCSYSLADGGYTQQYQVGDAGPNSGTITAVTVNSVLSGTQSELIGGFQETTETWNHTETLTEYRQDQIITTEIVEVITNVTREVVTEVQTPVTTTTTTETYTETTTSNLAPDISSNNYTSSGRVIVGPAGNCNHSGALQAGEACFGHANTAGQADGGGTITSNKFDIDTGLTQAELNRGLDLAYGYTLQSHQSNTTVPLCSKTSSDCKDEFKLTVNIYDSTTLINSYVHTTTLNWNGSRDISHSQVIPSNNYSLGLEAELVMWGVDAGYTNRYFGPIVSDPWLTVTYDIIGYVTETITTYVTEQVISYVTDQVISYEEVTNIELVDRTFTTELTDTTTVFTSEYIGDPIADIPVEDTGPGEEFTVEIEDVNGDVIAEFTVEVVEVEAGVVEVQIESTDSATGMVEIETVAVVETIQEIETLDTGMDTSMDTSSIADMDISVDSVDSIGDLAEVADIEIDTGSTDTAVEVEVEVDVETSVDSTSEVNTSSIEDTSTNETSESGETSGTTEANGEGTAETETDASTESTGDAGSDESTSESGDSGDEGQESEDVQDSDSGDESNDENTSEEVSESSSDVEESVEGSGDSDSKEGQDGDGDKKDSNKSGSGTKSKVKTKITKSPKEIKKATKAAITKKILQQISIAANQSFAAGENLRLVLLATQGDTQTFNEYQSKLPQQDTVWYNDQGIYQDVPQMEDPYGVLFSLAQDKKHEEMVEEQYRD